MQDFRPMRETPSRHNFSNNDVLVVFGELFQRGYANGIVDEALAAGMKVVYSTVGRRDANGELRPLNSEELQEKATPLINIPLEAGFDLEPSSKGVSPAEQLKGVKLSHWETADLDFEQINESRIAGRERFRTSVQNYLVELEKEIPDQANVIFAHTMAGGFPRAKVVMPASNRVFKGVGDRYLSSKQFWDSPIGRLCELSFNDVTGETLSHLLELSAPLREKIEARGNKVSYVSYGYHGTDILINGSYTWQSYAPYLQGFAKIRLEEIAQEYWDKGVAITVFNAPEILTNSTGIFLGVELSLYPLLTALKKEAASSTITDTTYSKCQNLLKEPHNIEKLLHKVEDYFLSEPAQQLTTFSEWPRHNFEEQMNLMRATSSALIDMHSDEKQLIIQLLSEVVFLACGRIMIDQAANPNGPVWWLGHDIIAKVAANLEVPQ